MKTLPIPSNEELPESVILDGREILNRFSMGSLGFKLGKEDKEQIIESLVSKLVSVNNPDLLDFEVEVCDFNRMHDQSIKNEPDKQQKLMQAVREVEHNLYLTVTQQGLFEKNNIFSYMFEQFLGDGIVIFKLPH